MCVCVLEEVGIGAIHLVKQPCCASSHTPTRPSLLPQQEESLHMARGLILPQDGIPGPQRGWCTRGAEVEEAENIITLPLDFPPTHTTDRSASALMVLVPVSTPSVCREVVGPERDREERTVHTASISTVALPLPFLLLKPPSPYPPWCMPLESAHRQFGRPVRWTTCPPLDRLAGVDESS